MHKKLLATLSFAALAGCGGGGGGTGSNSPGAPTEAAFTSFSAIRPNQTVDFSGMSQTASGNGDLSSTIASAGFSAVDTANTSAKANFDSSGVLGGLSISTPQGAVSFGTSISCSSGICDASNGSSEIIVVDAAFAGFNYQTFGLWDQSGSGTYQLGAFSIGNATPASGVPLSVSATFLGLATGFFIDSGGTPYATVADMEADASFTARRISFYTFNTTRSDVAGVTTRPDTGLDLSGAFSYAAGTNDFSGSLATRNGLLSGSGTGRFYGPNAAEIGGLYSVSGSGGSMLGAFGGLQVPLSTTQVPFTSFSGIQPNQAVVMSAFSQAAQLLGTPTTLVQVFVPTSDSITETYNSVPAVASVFIPSFIGLDSSAGDTALCSTSVCTLSSADGTRTLVQTNPQAQNWNYQTFGVWETSVLGAYSAGAATPAGAVPLSGTVTFSGLANGYYVDSAGVLYSTAANMNAIADFSSRNIGFSTSNTSRTNTSTSVTTADSGLNLSGTLSYAAGTNQFTGTVNTANAVLSGNAVGRFYGPAAQEIGGTYALTAPGATTMWGAFGGKQ